MFVVAFSVEDGVVNLSLNVATVSKLRIPAFFDEYYLAMQVNYPN